MSNFLENPEPCEGGGNSVICTKVEILPNIPSTRWGHTASVMNEHKLLILGGRNE
jgi:hypothetical protein